MLIAVSNIGLPAHDHDAALGELAGLGVHGLEVAPSRVWTDTWAGLTPAMVDRYRRTVEQAGLRVVGLHSLMFDQPGLGLFTPPDIRSRTLDFLAHLSSVCRDLGGTSLVFGSPAARRRGALPADQAMASVTEFFARLAPRIQDHGTRFCFEPLGPTESDFVNSVRDSLAIAESVGEVLALQIDAKALFAAGEATPEILRLVAPRLVHVHVNQPDLGELAEGQEVDHALLGDLLRGIGYDRHVSLEQRMVSPEDPLASIERSVRIMQRCYR